MSTKKKADEPLAIVCADIHLSMKPPVARAGEPNWFEAMGRPLRQLSDLQDEYEVPIICAGDIFDRWNSPPELINFALENLPRMFAIPGQHDLPNHNADAMHKSAFCTMVMADQIMLGGTDLPGLCLSFFPWPGDIEPLQADDRCKDGLNVAIVHSYIWREGKGHPKAPESDLVFSRRGIIETYDVVIFGDNHKGFQCKIGDTELFNCGTLMRRKSDEGDYRPQIGLLRKSGRVEPIYLDTTDDCFEGTSFEESPSDDNTYKAMLRELSKVGPASLDFEEIVREILMSADVEKAVVNAVKEAVDASKS